MRKTKEQNSRNNMVKENKGITLIALVITIIVMLILVAVTISMAVNGGLFDYAGKAAGETQNAIDEEQALANGRIKIDGVWYDDIDAYIQGEPSSDQGINYEEIFKTATKHPQQTETNDIGIAEDGSIVNLDLWIYKLVEDSNEYTLGEWLGSTGSPGYDGEISGGKIQGQVPMYIKEDGESEFYPVTRMDSTFIAFRNLTIAPKIPSSVTSMIATFVGCWELTTAPEIPNGVKNMQMTFWVCKKLTTAPEIPRSVTNLKSTFSDCYNLTGTLKINANPTQYDRCLWDAATEEGCALELTGPNEEVLNNILSTATSGNVTIKE